MPSGGPPAERVYLDHAATAPLSDAAREALQALLIEPSGNPSSVHVDGQRARAVLDEARAALAAALDVPEEAIVFTGSGTESDNLAVRGTAWLTEPGSVAHLVTTTLEHEAVLRTCRWLEARRAARVSWIQPGITGAVDAGSVLAALEPDTALVSVMAVNNETGVRQPIAELAAACRERGTALHVDAVQALGRSAELRDVLSADLVAFSAHKVGGPKGCGVLVVRAGTKLHPALTGGGQEGGLRPGTPNVAVIAAGAAAMAEAAQDGARRVLRLTELTQHLEAALAGLPGAFVNGQGAVRAPGITSVGFHGIRGSDLVMALDVAGFSVSAGSACASGSTTPSPVLTAMGQDAATARAAIRISLGSATTSAELDAFIPALQATLARLAGSKAC